MKLLGAREKPRALCLHIVFSMFFLFEIKKTVRIEHIFRCSWNADRIAFDKQKTTHGQCGISSIIHVFIQLFIAFTSRCMYNVHQAVSSYDTHTSTYQPNEQKMNDSFYRELLETWIGCIYLLCVQTLPHPYNLFLYALPIPKKIILGNKMNWKVFGAIFVQEHTHWIIYKVCIHASANFIPKV